MKEILEKLKAWKWKFAGVGLAALSMFVTYWIGVLRWSGQLSASMLTAALIVSFLCIGSMWGYGFYLMVDERQWPFTAAVRVGGALFILIQEIFLPAGKNSSGVHYVEGMSWEALHEKTWNLDLDGIVLLAAIFVIWGGRKIGKTIPFPWLWKIALSLCGLIFFTVATQKGLFFLEWDKATLPMEGFVRASSVYYGFCIISGVIGLYISMLPFTKKWGIDRG